LRTHGAELGALTAIAAQVNCTQDLAGILRGALQTTLEVMAVDAGEVYLVDEQTGELALHTQQGLSEAFVADEALIAAGDCLCGLAASTMRILQAEDIALHPSHSRPACLREGFRSLLCLPLRARGQVLGLLSLQTRRSRHFTPADQELLSAIGNQIGIAIANARLITDADRRRATLDSVMRSLVDGLILVDGRGRITLANPRAVEMLHLPEEALLGHTLEEVDAQIAVRRGGIGTLPLQAAATQSSGSDHVEFDVACPAFRTLQARAFSIRGESDDDLGQGVLLRDVSREKELDKMKSQLLATISHELRTPMVSIKGFASTLLRHDVEWDESQRREFLSIISEESDRLSELIDNLLDMARLEAGTLRVELEPVDVLALVQGITAEFQVLAPEHGISVDAPSEVPWVWADPRRIRQVLRNLVENAVKFSPQGGPIRLSIEVLAGSLQVSVADRGIGISADHLAHVFDRFYQVDGAPTRQVGGAGLGLSICKGIVEAHGGQIGATSEPGSGSTFTFTLPLSRPAHSPSGVENGKESKHPAG
jgi:signal transduction histidine kinase